MNDQTLLSYLVAAILVPLVLLPVGYFFWLWLMGRPPAAADRAVVPLYDPPEGLGPVEAGVLLDRTLRPRVLAALILDLALRGAIDVTEVGGRVESLRRADTSASVRLVSYEKYFLDRLFSGSLTVDSRSAAAAVARCQKDLLEMVRRTLREKGLMEVRTSLGLIILAAAVFGSIVLMAGAFVLAGLLGAVGIGAVSVLLGQLAYFGLSRPALSGRGRSVASELSGFRMYLGAAEGNRIRWEELEEKKVNRFTPFALVFGISVTWSDRLQHLSKSLLDNII